MSDVIDLNSFVSQLAQEGRHDSEGHFTLAEEKARKKLSDFALADPLAWVNKLLQALSKWNIVALEVKQTRLFTSFVFCPSDLRLIPSDKEILQVFESGHIDTESPLFLFCLALRTLVGQAEMSFLCNARYQEREFEQPLASGDDALHLGKGQRRAWTTIRSDGIVLTVSHVKKGRSITARYLPALSLFENVQFNADIGKLLEEEAPFLSFPVYLDTRLLNPIATHPQLGFRTQSQPLCLTGVQVEGLDPLPVSAYVEEKLMSLFTTPERCLRSYSRRRSFSVWLLIRVRTQHGVLKMRPNAHLDMCWLKYGVEARRRRFKLPNTYLDIHLFINGDGRETDLSGLVLIENDGLLELERSLLRAVRDKLDALANDVPNFLRDDLDLHSRLDRHSHIPTFDGKDIDQVGFLDVFSAPTTEVVFGGLPFLFGSVGYHFREVKAHLSDFMSRKDEIKKQWAELLTEDFHKLQDTVLENYARRSAPQ